MQRVSVRGLGPDLHYSDTQRGDKERVGVGERKPKKLDSPGAGIKVMKSGPIVLHLTPLPLNKPQKFPTCL